MPLFLDIVSNETNTDDAAATIAKNPYPLVLLQLLAHVFIKSNVAIVVDANIAPPDFPMHELDVHSETINLAPEDVQYIAPPSIFDAPNALKVQE